MPTSLDALNEHFDIKELENQLASVIDSKDPVGYMKSNINWEIDNDLDDDPELSSFTNVMADQVSVYKSYETWNPFRKFLNWFSKNRVAKKVKRILCTIADKLKELIDEEAELKTILGVALAAIVAAFGIGAINPMILTILVGLLATMILKGIDNVCAV